MTLQSRYASLCARICIAVLFVFITVVMALCLTGCATPTYAPMPAPPQPIEDAWFDGGFIGPTAPNPNWRTAKTGLHLGDIKLKRANAKRRLSTPAGWEAPIEIDNSAYVSAILDQGQTSECAAYSMVALLEAAYWRDHDVRIAFAPHAIYQQAKRIDRDNEDGTTLESIIEAVPQKSYAANGVVVKLSPRGLTDERDLFYHIHRCGFVWAGLMITDAWNKPDKLGRIADRGKPLGGHAVCIVGYSKRAGYVKILNSWGRGYGNGGFCYITIAEFMREFGYGYSNEIEWRKP